jgi:hypothetical protein
MTYAPPPVPKWKRILAGLWLAAQFVLYPYGAIVVVQFAHDMGFIGWCLPVVNECPKPQSQGGLSPDGYGGFQDPNPDDDWSGVQYP